MKRVRKKERGGRDEFQKAAMVVGYTLVDIDFGVGDSYLFWRLKQLSLSGKLETRGGNVKNAWVYEVRKRGKQ